VVFVVVVVVVVVVVRLRSKQILFASLRPTEQFRNRPQADCFQRNSGRISGTGGKISGIGGRISGIGGRISGF
jgi:hypothetical protein